MNLWPPFLPNNIRVLAITDDWGRARLVLKLRPCNRKYVGRQFGGNLFAMTDPFLMVLALHRLGPDYYVWDKAATIEFVAPAREHVFAGFQLDDHAVARLRSEAASGGDKVLYWFETEVATASGEVVVRVRKQLCVRPKPRSRPSRPRSATLSEGRRGRGDWHFSCMQIAGGVRPGIDRSGGMAARVAGRAWNAVHGQRTVSAK